MKKVTHAVSFGLNARQSQFQDCREPEISVLTQPRPTDDDGPAIRLGISVWSFAEFGLATVRLPCALASRLTRGGRQVSFRCRGQSPVVSA
jgi:hypothetical protein